MIGSENPGQSLDQLDAKLKPITPWSPAFSRALGSLLVFTLSFHWILMAFSLFDLIGFYYFFGFVFMKVNRRVHYVSLKYSIQRN